jgi:hypothetical protein
MKILYPIITSFQDFEKLLKQAETSWTTKELLYHELLFAQKERMRHREKSKRQYRNKKAQEELEDNEH